MEVRFIKIDEDNKLTMNKPSDCNMVYYSELNEWYTNNAFRNFSLKYVMEGAIQYKGGGFNYIVKKDELLISERQPGVIAQFGSARSSTKSICVDISPETINEVYTCLCTKTPGDFMDGLYYRSFRDFQFDTELLSVNDFDGKVLLQKLAAAISATGCSPGGNSDWVFALAELIVARKEKGVSQMQLLSCIKSSTKTEIFRRLRIGKAFMDNNFLGIHSIGEVAAYCAISEYHFIRMFRQLHHTTPYQYLLKKRLEFSLQLMKTEETLLSDIAVRCGFPDLPTYSKAFKRIYRIAPSVFRKEN